MGVEAVCKGCSENPVEAIQKEAEMTQVTPGPWVDGEPMTADCNWIVYCGPTALDILAAFCDPYAGDQEIAKSNARLAAAAPAHCDS